MKIEIDVSVLFAIYALGFFSGWLIREAIEAIEFLQERIKHRHNRRG